MTFPEFMEQKYLEWQLQERGRKTVVQFAAYLGVSQPILSMWMNGRKRPGTENIKMLAEIFGMEVYDALDLPRPNPYLQKLNRIWEFLPEEIQKRFSEEAEKYETENISERISKTYKQRKTRKIK